MEQTTKDILKNELYAGQLPAVELLYTRYSGMLFSYILQFIPVRAEAEELLVEIFSRLAPRLQDILDSSLNIYSWLQIESRKIILEYMRGIGIGYNGGSFEEFTTTADKVYYFLLLKEAPREWQWVFRELFIYGRTKEDLAAGTGRDVGYISGILRNCLAMIRKNLG